MTRGRVVAAAEAAAQTSGELGPPPPGGRMEQGHPPLEGRRSQGPLPPGPREEIPPPLGGMNEKLHLHGEKRDNPLPLGVMFFPPGLKDLAPSSLREPGGRRGGGRNSSPG